MTNEQKLTTPPTFCEPTGADVCRPLYEADTHDAMPRLVLTPWMLLDALKGCQDEAESLLQIVQEQSLGIEHRCGIPVNPVAERTERLHFGVSQLLRLLWRGGLWTETPVTGAVDAQGRACFVLRAPFTDGKPHGRSLHPDTPQWQRDLLGVSATVHRETPNPSAPITSHLGTQRDLASCEDEREETRIHHKIDPCFEMA